MRLPEIVFAICLKNDITVVKLAHLADIPPLRLALALEWRGTLNKGQRARLFDVGHRLKRERVET